MKIKINKLKKSVILLANLLKNDELSEFVRLNEYSEENAEKILKWLVLKLLDPHCTEAIAVCFPDILLALVALGIPIKQFEYDWNTYLKQSIALSKVSKYSRDVLRYSIQFFAEKEPPFKQSHYAKQPKRLKTTKWVTELDIMECTYYLLYSSPSFYKKIWDWSEFVDRYCGTSNNLQRLYYNQTLSILLNLTQTQLNSLNKHVPTDIIVYFQERLWSTLESPLLRNDEITDERYERSVNWDFSSSVVTSIEGIILPLYNAENAAFYNNLNESRCKIVRVDSTKINLKNLAMGLSSDKAICLVGPVGSGKTSLVEHLAKRTGRIVPNDNAGNENNWVEDLTPIVKISQSEKRKAEDTEKLEWNLDSVNIRKNGFLRIQLDDQTDTKILLGQYRCTDIPGEFVWFPGLLTQAVLKGYWLLLEDIDLAPPETCSMLSNLLETKYLCVPGFRDNVQISPGFQLFVTVRSPKSINHTRKSAFLLLEKYFYSMNILSMTKIELCQIVTENFPKLATIANRIVDIFLMFTSSHHLQSESARNALGDDSSEYAVLPITNDSTFATAMLNSGRTVSTRDLLKLCERCYLSYSAASVEYAYFVFENAVDVFCAYLPNSRKKRNLIVQIGTKLGIIESRCEYLVNAYIPDIENDSNGIKFGRAFLKVKETRNDSRNRHDTDERIGVVSSKKCKLDDNDVCFSSIKKGKASFSFTRLAACLLERIGVCVSHAEPILLVGETGVGKTCCIQYLAAMTNHRLVVVNMNNQSDVSDLVGGFKPVDVKYVLSPIRHEFESLFRATFNDNKNQKFLSNVSACYNRGDFKALIKLMIKIVYVALQNVKIISSSVNSTKNLLNQWSELNRKLKRINLQLEKSLNMSFAFIAGSLVKCIENGDWVLLDEINLASDETLECLSTILERQGSIVLLEKGDFSPIQRHPDFRIFACMNPRTDVGKKDLSTGIRNRFTEFFVDELRNESDLRILVGDYLRNTGINATKIHSIVKLFGKLKSLSENDLSDGLGNKPIYSLRTLCRALIICARNLCGSIERNLYESFCLSFLTQLDNDSHKIVLELIKTSLLNDAKTVLSQDISKPGIHYINFEGYWIKEGGLQIDDCVDYILTSTVRANLKDISRIISIGKFPILLQGPTSAGKTSLIEFIAKKSGNNYLRINNHEHTDLQEYIGTYIADNSGKLIFKEGVLVEAMRNGHWVILDELNLASTDILEALNRVLDENRELYIPETQTVIKAHANFMLFATQNPPGLYGGRKTLSRAFKNRFIELHFPEIPTEELEIILEKRCRIPKSFSKKMVRCMYDLQINRITTSRKNFTLRDLFRWGNRYTYANDKLMMIGQYDWNQHLVDEGYLILSSNARSTVEVDAIVQSLFNNFRKKVNLDNLYLYHNNTSLVTKSILQRLVSHPAHKEIVWTLNMVRMAVLTAKALEFHEPVLLVGPTGCGKTSMCQMLAEINKKKLRTLNCHMHTEGADFLGGVRPCRNTNLESKQNSQLFEWIDGPLIESMLEGTFFMADEISLAEDSVLERLNSVLEPSRTIVLAEKGGVSSEIPHKFIIRALDGFQFLATMNPGGDFGKKELSPALRNRFTEIWCLPSNSEEDLIKIANNALTLGLSEPMDVDVLRMAKTMVALVSLLKNKVEKFTFSVRDIVAWANYVNLNSKNLLMTFEESVLTGFNTLFLDSLEMLSSENEEYISIIKTELFMHAKHQLQANNMPNIFESPDMLVEVIDGKFGIKPFFIEIKENLNRRCPDFQFNTPTTKTNLFRLLSALTLKKAILLEGPPGVGKTSIIENLSHMVGYRIIRINLCEHTDLADLFGTDLPVEDKSLDFICSNEEKSNFKNQGAFAWRDGPLLSALKENHTWILLDELNLAPQSVLEGLNAILDHRGEVFIPELNKTFLLENETKIFACQNPLKQGGGRKGLPQSFLNRFTKVYFSKLTAQDLLHVIKETFASAFENLKLYFLKFFLESNRNRMPANLFSIACSNSGNEIPARVEIEFDLFERMVEFSEYLDRSLHSLDFGNRGGPFEVNLRDLLRWCEFLFDTKSGFLMIDTIFDDASRFKKFKETFEDFLLVLYERMKLIYYQRMKSESDRIFIQNAFSKIFQCNAMKLNNTAEDISVYWTDSELYLNDIVLKRFEKCSNGDTLALPRDINSGAILLTCQLEILKNVAEAINMEKVILISGPSNSGKTKIIDSICEVSNQFYDTEQIEDSVMGSFQQIDLVRHLEEVASDIEYVCWNNVYQLIKSFSCQTKGDYCNQQLTQIMTLWYKYKHLSTSVHGYQDQLQMSEELIIFKKRVNVLAEIIMNLKTIVTIDYDRSTIKNGENILKTLKRVVEHRESLIMGGHFEWIDSKIVKCLKDGGLICLEHANFCSPSVLDRLNSVFEPKGCLLLSEKGVNFDHHQVVVHKHSSFRVFLTIDPKNGDLSRAMRNRCVELDISGVVFSEDDYRQIIYINGIHEQYLIDSIFKVYKLCNDVMEVQAFNVAHLKRFTFLVSCNKRAGLSDSESVFTSATEVFINSSTVNVSGFGLDFYRNKLRDLIYEEIQSIKPSVSIGNMSNVIWDPNNMNQMSMVRLQCEPLAMLLKCYPDNEATKYAIKSLFAGSCSINFVNSIELMKIYIGVLYAITSASELTLRYIYLSNLLKQGMDQIFNKTNELQNANECVYKILKENIKFVSKRDHLPWNSKLYPRIKTYKKSINNLESKRKDELRVNALVFACLFTKPLEVARLTRLQKMSVIGYSKAVILNKISDNLNNVVVRQIWPLLSKVYNILHEEMPNLELYVEKYPTLIMSFLWYNRLYEISKTTLILNENLNSEHIDRLLLHIKWLVKKLIYRFEEIKCKKQPLDQALISIIQSLERYILENKHPLNLLQKRYTKQFLSFAPRYSEEQIESYVYCNRVSEITAISAHRNDSRTLRKILQFASTPESITAKNIVAGEILDIIKYLKKIPGTKIDKSCKLSNDINSWISAYFNEMTDTIVEGRNVEPLKKISYELEEIYETVAYNISDEQICSYSITDLICLKKYYGTRALLQYSIAKKTMLLNANYFENIPYYSCSSLQLFKILCSDDYRKFKKMWLKVLEHIERAEDISLLLATLSPVYYRNFSTFSRIMLKMLQLNCLDDKLNCTTDDNFSSLTLLDCLCSSLFEDHCGFKPIPFNKLNLWRQKLDEIRHLVWNNSITTSDDFITEKGELRTALLYSKKITLEIQSLENQSQLVDRKDFAEYNENFEKLLQFLITIRKSALNIPVEQNHPHNLIKEITLHTALIYSLTGAVELCVSTFLPLIDPVEKNRLKYLYENESQSLLQNVISVYDLLKVVMRYKRLANEEYVQFVGTLDYTNTEIGKLAKKLAKRPEICVYKQLVEHIGNFLKTSAKPEYLLELTKNAWTCIEFKPKTYENVKEVNSFFKESNEVLKKISLWIRNSQHFLSDLKRNYSTYYSDFTERFECCIVVTQAGLIGLKESLIKHMKSFYKSSDISFRCFSEDGWLYEVFAENFKFPQVQRHFRTDQMNNLQSILADFSVKLESGDNLCSNMLKAAIIDARNQISVAFFIDEIAFSKLEHILYSWVSTWKDEEEKKREMKIKEESLYISKVYCKMKNEDELEIEEIREKFPLSYHEDFAEFFVQDFLKPTEEAIKYKFKCKSESFVADEQKQIATNFIYIMETFTRSYYFNGSKDALPLVKVDYVTPFKIKMDVFARLVNKYKICLNSAFDSTMYSTYSFIIELQHSSLEENPSLGFQKNFYKDSNISEIKPCLEVMEKIFSRTKDQLVFFPDHAVLQDILRIIDKVKNFSTSSPIARFSAGFQILRQKLAQWNELAHKSNHFLDLETTVAVFIQKWTKLELHFWKNSLQDTFARVENDAYKFFPVIYNLLHEYIDAKDSKGVILNDFIDTMRHFLENSNYGDFLVRMNLLRSFELYLHHLNACDHKRKDSVIAALRNIQIYFSQFREKVESTMKTFRAPIEKNVRELVKIESYNKDLSYLSIKTNVISAHKRLNKLLKEFENHLRQNILQVFEQKSYITNDYSVDNDKGINLRFESKHKYYMMDAKYFLARLKLANVYKETFIVSNDKTLLSRCEKLFSICRNVVHDTIRNIKYPKMINSMDMLLMDQFETCERLRKLEVDRSKPKQKQISETKSILSQKKKGLSDLYKSISRLGFNFKTGLMELSLERNLTDYQIKPFCIKTMFATTKGRKIEQNLICLSQNLDIYYAKCTFRLKLLLNAMLMPNSDLGLMDVDRMKGFSTDMFLLIQNQRKVLSEYAKDLYYLQKIKEEIAMVSECVKDNFNLGNKLNFMNMSSEYSDLRRKLCEIKTFLDQYLLLLKCQPLTEKNETIALKQDSCEDGSVMRQKINSILSKISIDAEKMLHDSLLTERVFMNLEKLKLLRAYLKQTVSIIENLVDEMIGFGFDYLTLTKPLKDFLPNIIFLDTADNLADNDSLVIEDPDIILENVIYSLLLSLQKIYKKNNSQLINRSSENGIDTIKKERTCQIEENHLKKEIYGKMQSDIQDLRMQEVNKMLFDLMLAVKYNGFEQEGQTLVNKIRLLLPLLEQFRLMGEFYLLQQLGLHKVSTKVACMLLNVFIELATKGFCMPLEIMLDEKDEKGKENEKQGEGFGLKDGSGENDVSEKVESEDQLDDAKNPEDRDNEKDNKDTSCKEEKGIEMKENFDANLQDINNDGEKVSEESDKEEAEFDKQMSEVDEAAEKLDDQIWGSDRENEDEKQADLSNDEERSDSKQEVDKHNRATVENSQTVELNQGTNEGLDLTGEDEDKKTKETQKDVDSMEDLKEGDSDQVNPYHNELEEPSEIEEMNLDDCNLDAKNNEEEEDDINPFEIDKMKDFMETTEMETPKDDVNHEDKDFDPSFDTNSSSESEVENSTAEKFEENANDEKDEEVSEIKYHNPREESQNEEKEEDELNIKSVYKDAIDQPSKEENFQSTQVDNVSESENTQIEPSIDAGEESESIGHAESYLSETGHNGISAENQNMADNSRDNTNPRNRIKSDVNEDRTLGMDDVQEIKQLKTVEGLMDIRGESEDNITPENSHEYQHVRQAIENDMTTLDGATEDQSKKIDHNEQDEIKIDDSQDIEQKNMLEEEKEKSFSDVENCSPISAEKMEGNSKKSSHKVENISDKCESEEQIEVEGGEAVVTYHVPRGDSTTAHWKRDIILDNTPLLEDCAKLLKMQKVFRNELSHRKYVSLQPEDNELWQSVSNKMCSDARDFCEQLRLILEPTKCTRLKGDYRTGRRINMRKIIPYIASQFRKDKIWLRRTKPAQRDYKITIAIDDSKSMQHNNSRLLTLESISLVSQALTLLESGKLSILSFGESPKVLLHHTEQFDGAKLVRELQFEQNQSKIAELVDFVRIANIEEGLGGETNVFENLLLVISDGRNILNEGEKTVRNAIKLARMQRIFIVYVIIDNPENKYSILDIRAPQFSEDRKSITMLSYLDTFPFPYYVIVRDLGQLPLVLSEAMRQWFELVTNDR